MALLHLADQQPHFGRLLMADSLAAQDQTIRVKTDLVEVRAVVTNRKGQLVTGLNKEDFEILEDKRPQEISFFSVTRALTSANVSKAAAPNSIREKLASPPARTVVLFVDTLHMSTTSLLAVKQALHEFINKQLTAQDMIALVTSAGTLGIAEQFTRDRRLLLYAIERIGTGWPRRESLFTPYLAVQVDRGDPEALAAAKVILTIEDCQLCSPGMLNGLLEMRKRHVLAESDYDRMAAFASLKAILQRLSGLPGQRILALFSDGFTLHDSGGVFDTGDMQAAISQAVSSGVAIYSIQATGLQAPLMVEGHPLPSVDKYKNAAEFDARSVMDALALNTGGESFYNTNDLSGALTEALDRNSLYYVLAYYPPDSGEHARVRRLTVKVRGHPEYTVRAPRQYVRLAAAIEPAGKTDLTPEERLRDAIKAPLPSTGIEIDAAADFIESSRDDAKLSVTVHVDGGGLQYRQENDLFHFSFQLVTSLYDSAGKLVQTLSDKVQGKLKLEHYETVRRNGIDIRRRYAVSPGVYQARVGVIEEETGRLGTAAAFVEVPNLEKSKLSLSSIVLLDIPDGEVEPKPEQTAVPSPSKVVQGIRFYERPKLCTFGFRVYLNLKGAAYSTLMMRLEFLQGGRVVRQEDWQPLSRHQVGTDTSSIAVGGQVKIADFAPGVYELRISVKDPLSKKTVQGTALFGVDPEGPG